MTKEELEVMALKERLTDWRFWVVYLISVILITQLLFWFFQVESFVVEIVLIIAVSLILSSVLDKHYINSLASEKGIKLE